MASRKRALLEPTDDWQQLQFQLDWPEQQRYELIRPVVVFGSPPVERAEQTGVSARTIYRRVERFDELGMQSLFEAEPVEDKRALPWPSVRRSSSSRPSTRLPRPTSWPRSARSASSDGPVAHDPEDPGHGARPARGPRVASRATPRWPIR